jgi:hypothetical protein
MAVNDSGNINYKQLKNMEHQDKIAKAARLYDSFEAKAKLFREKAFRARTGCSLKKNSESSRLYSALENRSRNLLMELLELPGKNIREGIARECIMDEYKAVLKRKEERRRDFMGKHRYSMWFLSNSLGSDYGLFHCGKCGAEFYHSPSTIRLGGKIIYQYCCGRCTNDIISRDWGKYPYN